MLREVVFYCFRAGSAQGGTFFKCVNLEKDYYRVLEVQCGACENAIKKSYLRLVKQHHPDFNPAGHDTFTELQEAYHILSDKTLRGYYDQNSTHSPHAHTQHTQHTHHHQEDPRNEQFYSDLKDRFYRDRDSRARGNTHEKQQEQEQQEQPRETEEEARERRRFEDEINLTRRILFTKNPIWERANAYMNYEERQRRVEEKEKQFESLFPTGAKLASSFKKWML